MIVRSEWQQPLLVIMAVCTFLLAVLALCTGTVSIPIEKITALAISIPFERDVSDFVDPWIQTVIVDVRFPRVLVAMMVGGALALSGTILQALFSNPLASPSILGVSSGAAVGAVVAIFFGLSAALIWVLPLFAFLGAGLTLLLVYRVASYKGAISTANLLLAGIAVGALNASLISLLTAVSFDNYEVSRLILYWTMGGLEARLWIHVLLMVPIFLISLGVLLYLPRVLDLLVLGEVSASSVGLDTRRTRLILLIVTAILISGSVSVSGGIGFVGLVVPHIMRLLVGPGHLYLLPYSFVGGAFFLLLADWLLRTTLGDQVIPLGVFTSMIGGPFFLYLLMRSRRKALVDAF